MNYDIEAPELKIYVLSPKTSQHLRITIQLLLFFSELFPISLTDMSNHVHVHSAISGTCWLTVATLTHIRTFSARWPQQEVINGNVWKCAKVLSFYFC